MKSTLALAILIIRVIAAYGSCSTRDRVNSTLDQVNSTQGQVNSTTSGMMSASAQSGSAPEAPRVYLNTDYTPPTGRTIAVAAGGDFQGALNQAQPGDVITLQAGAIFTGNFTLPNKSGSGQSGQSGQSGWIVIRSSTAD